MITIFGALGLSDRDPRTVNEITQPVVYDGLGLVLGDHNDDTEELEAFFVEKTTEKVGFRYKMEGGGYLQEMGRRSPTGEVKGGSSYTVQFPLENAGAAIASDDIAMAYMSLEDFDVHVRTVLRQDKNTRRYKLLRAIFLKEGREFEDDQAGTLNIRALASNDGTLYPPVEGSVDQAEDSHYLGTPADWTTINDVKNPIPMIVAELEEHFGATQGGSPIVVIFNPKQAGQVEALEDFVPVGDNYIAYGNNVSLALEDAFPEGLPPGKVIGRCNGATIVSWPGMPLNYVFAKHLGAPAPLIKRLDTAKSGLITGLHLLPDNPMTPLEKYVWRNRYGYGVGNRLNGVVVDLTAAGGANTYTNPSMFVL